MKSVTQKVLFCILLVFGGLLLYAVFLMTPPGCEGGFWLCYGLGVERKESVVRGLGIAIAGTLSIWAVWIAHCRAEEMKKQTDVAHRTVCATEDRLVQERFRDAVGHLGHDSESVRLNGAYALFRLAVQEKSFRAWVAQTLCLHIVAVTSGRKYQKTCAKKPSAEIQALMRLLFERGPELEAPLSEAERGEFWKGFPIDLSGGYFCGLALRRARFQRADLADAEFQGAKFLHAEFQGADLKGARFQGAALVHARFQGAALTGAEFQGAKYLHAKFQGADLAGARFQGADLVHARFRGADLAGAEFQGADLLHARFQGAGLTKAQFQGAKSVHAEFQGAVSFEGREAFFTRRSRRVTSFSLFEQRMKAGIGREADVSGAIFAGGLEQEKVERMVEELRQVGRAPEEEIQAFEQSLSKHVGREVSHVLPDEARGGAYDEAQARVWIEEYEEALKDL